MFFYPPFPTSPQLTPHQTLEPEKGSSAKVFNVHMFIADINILSLIEYDLINSQQDCAVYYIGLHRITLLCCPYYLMVRTFYPPNIYNSNTSCIHPNAYLLRPIMKHAKHTKCKGIQFHTIAVQSRGKCSLLNFGHTLFEYPYDGLTWEKVLQIKKYLFHNDYGYLL